MTSDSLIVQEVWQRAMEISSEFGHDVRKYGEYLRRKQQEPRNRMRVVSQLTVVSRPEESQAPAVMESVPADIRPGSPTS